MKDFNRLAFDQAQCGNDLAAFRDLLAARSELEESTDIKPFFEARPQLALFLGTVFSLERSGCDLYAFPVPTVRRFRVRPPGRGFPEAFLPVRGMGGRDGQLPVPPARAKSDARMDGRLKRGFSQLVDWFWKMEDMAHTDEFEARFGSRHAEYGGLLVMGRDAELTHPRERNRWHWRSRRVTINGRGVRLVTYDQLYQDLVILFRHMFPPPVI